MGAISNMKYLLLLIFLSCSSFAIENNLQISGTLVNHPCKVVFDENDTIYIDLGDNILDYVLSKPGSASPWIDFDIFFSDCPANSYHIIVTFHGTTDSSNTYYVNTGTAQNVGIELDRRNVGWQFPDGQSAWVDIINGEGDLDLAARLFSVKGGATPGTINSTVTVSIEYF